MKDLFEQLRKVTWRKSILCAIAVLVIYTTVCGAINPILIPVGVLIIALYICAALFLLRRDVKTNGLDAENSAILGITLDFVTNFRSPAIILSPEGIISWYNTAFISASESRRSMYGKSAAEIIDSAFTPSRIEQLQSGATFSANYNGTDYEVSGYALNSGGKQYCMIVLENKSELVRALKKLKEENTVIAFVMLDNISETLSFSQDKYRSASARVAGVISEWASGLGGMTKEYDRDKFIVVFEEKSLPGILASKFDILDRIRETEIESLVSPITASIGMSNIGGTVAEKETAARSALELALQRGGDQAVLRTENSTEYYGGKTKTVQKKTKIRSRVIAGELTELIKNSGNVIIMGHKFCDHDSIASCVAVARIATYLKKPVKIVINLHDANLKPVFSKMRGLTYYHELFTDAASAQDMLLSDTLLIICDVNNPKLFEAREIYDNCINYVIIDHHRKVQEEYAIQPKLSYIEPSASSASELVSEIAEYAMPQGSLTKTEADLLLAGIVLDTNNFRKNTGVGTFSSALFLRSQGADPVESQDFFRTTLDEFLYEADIERNITIYRETIIIASTDLASTDSSQTKLVSAKCADRLLNIAGVDATFVLAQVGQNVNVSARSAGKINVQLIVETLGGGGHFDAAGTLLRDISLSEANAMIKNAIDAYFDEKKQ